MEQERQKAFDRAFDRLKYEAFEVRFVHAGVYSSVYHDLQIRTNTGWTILAQWV